VLSSDGKEAKMKKEEAEKGEMKPWKAILILIGIIAAVVVPIILVVTNNAGVIAILLIVGFVVLLAVSPHRTVTVELTEEQEKGLRDKTNDNNGKSL